MTGAEQRTIVPVGSYCVYAHFTGGECFYIGMGSAHRAFTIKGRTERWRTALCDRSRFEVEILAWFEAKEDALAREAEEISKRLPLGNFHGVVRVIRQRQRRPTSYEEATVALFNTLPLRKAGLSLRTAGALVRAGMQTLGAVASLSDSDLLACKNFGLLSLRETRAALDRYGWNIIPRDSRHVPPDEPEETDGDDLDDLKEHS